MHVEKSIGSMAFGRAIKLGLIQQIAIAIVCLLLLDFGVMAKVCAVAIIAYWSAVSMLLMRRSQHLSTTDLGFLRWGFLPIFLISKLVGSIWLSWK